MELESDTEKDPWTLQYGCLTYPEDCTKHDVYNETRSWLQVSLEDLESGEKGFFTIQKKGFRQITLIPGQYKVTLRWWCDGEEKTTTEYMGMGRWKDYVKCPQGYYKRLSK